MNNIKGKKLLILGGASQHCKVVEAAHKLGVKVYVADYLEEAPAKSMADQSYLIDIKAIDRLVELCKEEKIDGAIATSLDACQIPYQKLCEIMNYPCFGTEEQYKILTNKRLFKECCELYGVDTIPSYSYEDILNDGLIEYPIFIKPVDSRGSRGQSICLNRRDALMAIDKARNESSNNEVIIEKYMGNCQDFTISYLVVNGSPILLRTGDRFGGQRGSGLENLCIASCSPSKYTNIYLKEAHKKIIRMLKGIGLNNAPVFFQAFIDGNKVRLYDPGLRFAGGEYERVLKITSGIDVFEFLIYFALTGESMDINIDDSIYELSGKRMIQLDPTLRAGIISEIHGLNQIKEKENVIAVSQRYFVGDEIFITNDLRQRFAEICILNNDMDEEVEDIHFVQNTLRIIDLQGRNMLCDPFDTSNIYKE